MFTFEQPNDNRRKKHDRLWKSFPYNPKNLLILFKM